MKRYKRFLLVICFPVLLCGCSAEKTNTEKIRDVEFTVVEEEKIPEEFQATIEKKKEAPFKLTFRDDGYLYIAEGYGVKPTSGYSVGVDECYETANAVYIHTNLSGPSKEETKVEADTFPYVVIKMELIDKNVVFK